MDLPAPPQETTRGQPPQPTPPKERNHENPATKKRDIEKMYKINTSSEKN